VAGNWAFSEVRPIMYYLVAGIAAWAVRSRKGLYALLIGLFLMSNLTATVLVLQQFLGRNNPLLDTMTGNEWYVRVQSSGDSFGAVRIVPPGHMLMYALTIVAFSLLLYSNQARWVKRLLAFEFVYLNFALLLTYTRAQWLASAIAMFIVIITLPRLRWRQLANRLSLLIVALVVLIALFGSTASGLLDSVGFLSALSNRILSIFNPTETLESSSLQWRLYETETSLKAIRENPLLGVGVGNSYRDVTLLDGEARGWLAPISNGNFRGLTRFVHNSYLHIAVKMGLPALALFLLFIVAVLLDGFRLYRSQTDLLSQRLIIALLASLIGALQWSITEHNLIQVDAVIAIGLMVGIIAAIEALPAQATNPTQPLIPSPQPLAYE